MSTPQIPTKREVFRLGRAAGHDAFAVEADMEMLLTSSDEEAQNWRAEASEYDDLDRAYVTALIDYVVRAEGGNPE